MDKESPVDKIMKEAAAASEPKETVEMHLIEGRVFMSAESLIQFFGIISRKNTLSKADKAGILKCRQAIEKYNELGLQQIPYFEKHPDQLLQPGDKVEYIGGQLSPDQEKYPVYIDEPYQVVQTMTGDFGGHHLPGIEIDAYPGVSFQSKMFKKIKEDAKIIQI